MPFLSIMTSSFTIAASPPTTHHPPPTTPHPLIFVNKLVCAVLVYSYFERIGKKFAALSAAKKVFFSPKNYTIRLLGV
jgi:hypothetical protein